MGTVARWRPLGVSVTTVVGVLVWDRLGSREGVVGRLLGGSEGLRGMVRMVDIVAFESKVSLSENCDVEGKMRRMGRQGKGVYLCLRLVSVSEPETCCSC